jgi:hypothetical protein
MDVKELVTRGTDKVVALYCGKCGIVHPLIHPEWAEQCCKPAICECGQPKRAGHTACDACWKASQAAKEQARFEKAEKIPFESYKIDFLYCEGLGNDGFVPESELGEILGEMAPKDRPKWMWACKEIGLRKLDAVDLVASLTEDLYEDADEQVDTDELQRVLDEWHAKQHVISYEADETKAVLLDAVLVECAKQDEEEGARGASEVEG